VQNLWFGVGLKLALDLGRAAITPPAMLLVAIDARSAELRSPLKLRPPIVIAVAFWFAASLPLIVPEHTTLGHYASSALFAAVGIALAHTSFRQQRRFISFDDATFSADGRVVALAHAREIALTGSDGAVIEPTYQAELVFDGGQRELLLEHHEPARVIRDLSELLPHLRLPVRRGWGLPEGISPWESQVIPDLSADKIETESEVFEVPLGPAQRRPGYALTIGAVVLATVQVILVAPTVQRSAGVSPLSIGLALASVVTVLLLGVFVWTRELVVKVGPQVAIELRLLGRGLKTLAAAPAPLRGAWAVSPEGRSPQHVLIATEGKPLSVACEGSAASALAHRLAEVR
jgi:hypothetical protein